MVEKIGGPSVRPYMPAGVWDETSKYGNLRNYQVDQGAGQYRRTLYTIWKRTAAPPTMLLFDAPNREICTVKRSRTNTPLQALSLLNEVTFVEAAKNLARRMLLEGGSDDAARIRYGFRLAVSRQPRPQEMSVLLDGLAADRRQFQLDVPSAEKLVGKSVGNAEQNPAVAPGSPTGDSPTSTLPSVDWAAYTLAANILLNLDEFVTRE
ncbi:MAG: DUF1553 domain-containing protein [Pirellulaceae bacterium]|nr:DUF1553 domain-containing protein [Pirellulaceae bacterium]